MHAVHQRWCRSELADALQGVRVFRKWDPHVAGKPYFARLHNAAGLPTGATFNEAAFRMLTAGEGTVRSPLPLPRCCVCMCH